ncbi:CHAT domain-containing protein [Bradyrhizobium sp. UFLA05-112]
MTAKIAIATAEQDMFDTLSRLLHAADIARDDVHAKPLKTADQTSEWITAGEPGLLVLDAELPIDPRARRDTRSTRGARSVFEVVRAREPRTPVLVIVPNFAAGAELEAECTATGNALMLPMDTLQLHQHRILRPFIAMLTGRPDNTNAIPGGFRVIETEIQSSKVECRLGVGDGATMLRWNTVSDLEDLKSVAQDYARDEMPQDCADPAYRIGTSLPRSWLDKTRVVGTRLFKSFVVKAVGEQLFSQIENAAGGLEGLSFRFVINDADFYPAPFEASVRYLRTEENGPFVLLHAPIVRRIPPAARLRAPAAQTRIPRGATLLFVRSQVGEHPAKQYERVTYDGKQFDKLGNIDIELQYLRALREADHFDVKEVDLSQAPPGKAATHLLARIHEVQPTILHYAGHAWSDGQKSATLILPGEKPEEAMGLKLDKLAAHHGLSATRLVYLSACRGISKGSVQQLVMNGIPYALGFRWNVEDDRAPDFARAFYNELCMTQSVCLAFRRACRTSWEGLSHDEESPIWISPILLAQSTDWAMRS